MTIATPDVPLRMEHTFELPGTPEQVWAAIATGNGNSSWFTPTDFEEREGGALVFHMGEDASHGEVTRWEPLRRLEYVEPGWAGLAGHPGEPVTPLRTEFLIKAQSGGTCLLTVVTSAFGTGADWEAEWFADMERSWLPYFDNLRVYLAHFAGQRVTNLIVEEVVPGTVEGVWSQVRGAVGANEPGQPVAVQGLTGRIERISAPPDGAAALLVHVHAPWSGMLAVYAWDKGNGEVSANVQGYLFSEDAPDYVERGEPSWRKWLASMAAPTS